MASTARNSSLVIPTGLAISAALVLTMLVTYLCLVNAERLTKLVGPMGIDAGTRIVGFFVSAIGVGLVFNGVFEALQAHGVPLTHV